MPPKTNEDLIQEFMKPLEPDTDGVIHVMPHVLQHKLRTLLTEKDKQREEAVAEALAEYKQFVINVLYGVDIADGYCNTKAIRFALESRTITPPTREL